MASASQDHLNHTGILRNPSDGRRLKEFADQCPADPPGSDAAIAKLREICIRESDSVGCIPSPPSGNGRAEAGTRRTNGNGNGTAAPLMLLDKLGERLAFERSGVRLYEALIVKAATQGEGVQSLISKLRHFRDEEAEHFHWVSSCIAGLNADPTAQTPAADVGSVATAGMLHVMTDPRTDLFQSLNALLAVELMDQCGWELLIRLAESAGHNDMAETFRTALRQENDHLEHVKRWVTDMAIANNG